MSFPSIDSFLKDYKQTLALYKQEPTCEQVQKLATMIFESRFYDLTDRQKELFQKSIPEEVSKYYDDVTFSQLNSHYLNERHLFNPPGNSRASRSDPNLKALQTFAQQHPQYLERLPTPPPHLNFFPARNEGYGVLNPPQRKSCTQPNELYQQPKRRFRRTFTFLSKLIPKKWKRNTQKRYDL